MQLLDYGSIELIDSMGNDGSIVNSARVSYKGASVKKLRSDEGLIRYLMTHGHSTPFESVVFTFHIKCPIFVARQWMRHRTWSYNEISGRYSELPGEMYMPEAHLIKPQSKSNKQGREGELDAGVVAEFQEVYNYMYSASLEIYQSMLKKGVTRELARLILPVATYTEFYGTVNLWNLFRFLRQRIDPHAQYEIRVYAYAIFDIIAPLVPFAVDAWLETIPHEAKREISEQCYFRSRAKGAAE